MHNIFSSKIRVYLVSASRNGWTQNGIYAQVEYSVHLDWESWSTGDWISLYTMSNNKLMVQTQNNTNSTGSVHKYGPPDYSPRVDKRPLNWSGQWTKLLSKYFIIYNTHKPIWYTVMRLLFYTFFKHFYFIFLCSYTFKIYTRSLFNNTLKQTKQMFLLLKKTSEGMPAATKSYWPLLKFSTY